MKFSRSVLIGFVLVIAITLVAIFFGANRGYGEVSPRAYEFAKALYSVCLSKSDDRLEKVDDLISDDLGQELPLHERRWLENIIGRARSGDWETAAENARRMMQDQVQF